MASFFPSHKADNDTSELDPPTLKTRMHTDIYFPSSQMSKLKRRNLKSDFFLL